MPVACRAVCAKAHTTWPAPQATSSTVSSGPAPLHSTMSRSAASSLMWGEAENGPAWRVNWSRTTSRCEDDALIGRSALLHREARVARPLGERGVVDGDIVPAEQGERERVAARRDAAAAIRDDASGLEGADGGELRAQDVGGQVG